MSENGYVMAASTSQRVYIHRRLKKTIALTAEGKK